MNFTLAFQLLMLFLNLLPALVAAGKEVFEAFEASGSDLPAEQKIQAAVEAGIACYDLADKQFNLPDAMDSVMRTQFIPALCAMLFYGAHP